MRRRTLLGTVSGTITTWITGCLGGVSTEGNATAATTTRNRCDQVETWSGVECEVSPTEIRQDAATGDYRLDCELSVRFEFPSGDTGFGDAPAVGRTLRLRHGGDAGPERYVLEFEDGRSVRLPAPDAD